MDIITLGAGPAGLTAAYLAGKEGFKPTVFEKNDNVGGISRTVDYKDFLFDIGGHRFFTKYQEVETLWHEILGDEFLTRPRLSRIYYDHKFYYYPLKPLNALKNLGLDTSLLVVFSFIQSQLFPYKAETNFEEWVSNRFGKKLFNTFFKTYTEKVWGMPCTEIQADWAAQRIKSLSLSKLIFNSFGFLSKGQVTTLIDQFQYPRRGPGQMWNKAKELVEKKGGGIRLNTKVVQVNRKGNRIQSILTQNSGPVEEIKGDHFISTLPLRELIRAMAPSVPERVRQAAENLKYRDFFTVGLILAKSDIFPDNWIYIHSPEVLVGRIQNFKNWSPAMVPSPDLTTLGLEYFCFESDEIWKKDDKDLIELAKDEVEKLNFATKDQILDGVVIRSPKTYPIYDDGYKERVSIIKDYLSSFENLQTIGRNGLHRYNNQDHSMLSAIYAVENIKGGNYSVWDINTDDEYHEIKEENR
ncbi:MAG: NAD(P)/FAD-dependent oxidoreductase [Candidatus Aminicenantes bacterium]